MIRHLRNLLFPARAKSLSCNVSAVLPTYNRLRLLQASIANLRRELAGLDHEIIVVDGGSTDGSIDWLARQTDILLIVQHNRLPDAPASPPRRSWGYFVNLGFMASRGKHILMTSDDCLFVPGSVAAGLRMADSAHARSRLGGVAFFYRDWPRDTRYFVRTFADGRVLLNHGLLERSALERVRWVEEAAYPFYRADTDLCLRLWHSGYRIVPCPDAFVEHYYVAEDPMRNANKAASAEAKAAFALSWGKHYTPGSLKIGKLYSEFSAGDDTAAQFPVPAAPRPKSDADAKTP